MANNNLSLVNVGIDVRKRSKFDLSHDNSTTYGFGETQPLNCQLIALGDTTINFGIDTLVRLSPLVSPTFSRLFVKHWHNFVALKDICPKYEAILSGVPVQYYSPQSRGTTKTTVITQFPTVSARVLMYAILRHASFCCYNTSTHAITTQWHSVNLTSNVLSDDTFGKIFGVANYTTSSSNIFNPHNLDLRKVDYGTPEHWMYDEGDFSVLVDKNDHYDMFSFRLSNSGRRLYKILLGLGYKVTFTDGLTYNSLPIYAYYKAYFDRFLATIPQYENWFTTSCYELINHFDTYCSDHLDIGSPDLTVSDNYYRSWLQFLDDLSNCWVTENADFISAHTSSDDPKPASRIRSFFDFRLTGNGVSSTGSPLDSTDSYVVESRFSNVYSSEKSVSPAFSSDFNFSQIDDEILKRMYYYCNRNSALGNDIASLLRSMGFNDYVEKCQSYMIGEQVTPIEINAVTNTTSGVDGSPLGDYAGQGVKYENGHKFTFTAQEPGYIISIGAIVPQSSWSLGVDVSNGLLARSRWEWYQPEFDGFGLEPSPRAIVGSFHELYDNNVDHTDHLLFGYVPRMTGYKVKNNTLNGLFALHSKLDTFSPYTLDKIVLQGHYKYKYLQHSIQDGYQWLMIGNTESNAFPNAGEAYRFPTRYSWLGNFRRIFADGGIVDDNFYTDSEKPQDDDFLSHNIIHFEMWSRMLPVADSYETEEIQQDTTHRTLSVKK